MFRVKSLKELKKLFTLLDKEGFIWRSGHMLLNKKFLLDVWERYGRKLIIYINENEVTYGENYDYHIIMGYNSYDTKDLTKSKLKKILLIEGLK
jgi:hypothetical protein